MRLASRLEFKDAPTHPPLAAANKAEPVKAEAKGMSLHTCIYIYIHTYEVY